jgi:hypothetical protein
MDALSAFGPIDTVSSVSISELGLIEVAVFVLPLTHAVPSSKVVTVSSVKPRLLATNTHPYLVGRPEKLRTM